MTTDILVQVLSGVSRGMVLFVVASGLTLIFGVLRIANFAHGSFYMLAAFFTYTVTLMVGDRNLGFLAAILVAPVAVALIGAGVEVLLLRRIAVREHQYQLILTYALTLIIADLTKLFWGRDYHSVPRPTFLDGSIPIFDRPFPSYYALLVMIGMVIAIALSLLLSRTRLGKVARAAVSDREMVNALGVNVPLLYTAVFGIGAWLAGLGGALAAPVGSIALGMDSSVIIESFAVVIIGGVGSVPGAFVGSMIIGIMQALGIMVVPRLAIAFIFLVLCAVLIVRPQGLLGRQV